MKKLPKRKKRRIKNFVKEERVVEELLITSFIPHKNAAFARFPRHEPSLYVLGQARRPQTARYGTMEAGGKPNRLWRDTLTLTAWGMRAS